MIINGILKYIWHVHVKAYIYKIIGLQYIIRNGSQNTEYDKYNHEFTAYQMICTIHCLFFFIVVTLTLTDGTKLSYTCN